MRKKGDRVGAILKKEGKNVYLIGYGTYEGEEIPPKEIRGFNFGIPNPKIKLDSGKVVWGCECWWGDEEEFKENFEKPEYEIIQVDIDKERKENNQ